MPKHTVRKIWQTSIYSVLTLQEFLTHFTEAVSIFVAHPALCDRVLPQWQEAGLWALQTPYICERESYNPMRWLKFCISIADTFFTQIWSSDLEILQSLEILGHAS